MAIPRLLFLGFLFFACRPGDNSLPAVREIDHQELRELVGQHKGKVVLVNAWATWCAPCREEMPALLRIRREFRDRGFELILVSTDDPELLRTRVQPMLRDFGVDFQTYINNTNDEAFIASLAPEWSGALPTSFVYGRNGKLVEMLVGAKSYDRFAKTVEGLLS